MIRLSRFALCPMRQRACITLHHAAQLHPHRRTCNRPYASSVVRAYTYSRYTWTARDYGYHVDDWIKCISHARTEHTRRIHISYRLDPSSAEYFGMRSRDEGVIPRHLYGNRVPYDRESRSRL